MYKLIALDLDGTLTDKNKNILEETKQELIKLAQKGVIIVLASGRPTAGIFKEAKELTLDQVGGYLLSFNGARVLDYKTNEVVYEQTLSSEIAHEMYDRAKAFGLSPLTYNATEIITEDMENWIQLESFTTKMNIKHVQDFKKEVNFDVNKVLITGEPAYVAQILDDFKKPYEGKMSIYRSDPYFIECMANGIDKAASLDVLCKKLGIKQEETVAFGDGYNDLSLIEYCGYGVAMENAVDEVKERANYITLSNNDNGIAYCLKQLEEKGLI
ncbi:MAG: Cof-type HAD-IIB family hydrolase [Faecalibacillus sp.]